MENPRNDRAERFSEAVAAEVRAELARREGMSVRDLANLLGVNHNAINDRLNGRSTTGKKVPINVRDLADWSAALGLPPETFLVRAQEAIDTGRDFRPDAGGGTPRSTIAPIPVFTGEEVEGPQTSPQTAP